MTAKQYRSSLAERMRTARLARNYTQAQMGTWLSVGEEAYRKHETRGSLPPYLFEHFSALTGIDALYLLTGHEPAKQRKIG